ncbi:MAG: hypothetical protein OQJ80_06995 [Kangiella sp.]|nr:hypothetical protein [Kangiella sp.]
MTPKQEIKAVLSRMVMGMSPYRFVTDGLYINANSHSRYTSFKARSQEITNSLWLFLLIIGAKVTTIDSVKELPIMVKVKPHE